MIISTRLVLRFLMMLLACVSGHGASFAVLEKEFQNPPDSARPGVYWYFMDGNLDREAMTADLESMKEVGLGNLVFLEVFVGVPRGPVKFMSDEWQELFAHAVHEAERLGIDITLGSGPGWTGSGGPWVKPEQSMQHLVFSEIEAKGPKRLDRVLPVPEQRSTQWHTMRSPFYEDVAIYAFPRCEPTIRDIDEKALYERDPYSSKPGVKPYLPAPALYQEPAPEDVIAFTDMVDLSRHLEPDGRLRWNVPAGDWTIVRMGRRSTGASTRPAPESGIGFDCDKFDAAAFDNHFENFVGKLLKKVGKRKKNTGWTTLHMDSWEMGAQNWTPKFREEFQKRRGYDPKPYFPAYTGRVVGSMERTERFLWDVRLTGQELVLENYAERLKDLCRQHDFELSIEPYDMNPTADLDLGAVADVPMAEFWSVGHGFDSSFSCIESTSIAHTMGRPIVSAEAFTAQHSEGWRQYPASVKDQGDWAFCMGINRFVYHTFAHKPLGEEHRPGMSMGPYGVHWDRGQTWWPMVKDYHLYVSRCSLLLRQGVTVSDVLYLTPEGAPHVFRPPASALEGKGPLADKKGYGFDGCSPKILMERAEVKDGRIAFPGGSSYRLIVLPQFETMTPELLAKIEALLKAGATIVGSPPHKSPSLVKYPACDADVESLAKKLWGGLKAPREVTRRNYGKGVIYWGGNLSFDTNSPKAAVAEARLYQHYDATAALLKRLGVREDFSSNGPLRYGHRRSESLEIYFVSNKIAKEIQADCTFRVGQGQPELWNPVTGERRALPQYQSENGLTTVPLEFDVHESFFVVFPRNTSSKGKKASGRSVNFSRLIPAATLEGSWEVSFDPKWGGPEKTTFKVLQDWIKHRERGIKYYSGIATYRKSFDQPKSGTADEKIYLDLGTVNDIARVRLNGKDLGVVWCAPWRVEISDVIQAKDNQLEIEVANRWPNRLLGDSQAPDAGVRTVQWPSGLLGGKEFQTGRYTFSTTDAHKRLLSSGLLGPVRLMRPR